MITLIRLAVCLAVLLFQSAISAPDDDTTIVTMEGVNCLATHYVIFPQPWETLTLSNLTSCQHFDDYRNTCLGSYDGGEDYIIQFDIVVPVYARIRLDPHGTAWTGIALDSVCPPGPSCMAFSSHSGSAAHELGIIRLLAGSYYLIVDTWPQPNCIPSFEVEISQVMGDPFGVDCVSPFGLQLAMDELPLVIKPIHAATFENDMSASCLGEYDSGEDVFYRLYVQENLDLSVRLDPDGVAGSGFVIDSICPPGLNCIASAVDETGQTYGVSDLKLPAGQYFFVIDSRLGVDLWNLSLTIESSHLCGDPNADNVISISDVIHVINYVFAGGEAPYPMVAGDVDQNSLVNISDAVYLINYIFASGTEPCGGTLESQ